MWRDRLPFVRWGLAELQIMGWPLLALASVAVALARRGGGWTAIVPAGRARAGGSRSFAIRSATHSRRRRRDRLARRRHGRRRHRARALRFFDGPAVRIGIFLSIFNVHINRAPRAGRVLAMHYKPGEFLDARNPESAIRNEFMWIGFEDADAARACGSPCGRFRASWPGESSAPCGPGRP